MASGPRSVRVAVFGSFRFDLTSRDLRKHGIHLRLEEKPALVLQRLIESSGAVVTRKELQELLWPNGIHVDFNHGLNKSVNRLRAVLGDDRDQPRYIETLSKRGYRFIAPLDTITEPPTVGRTGSAVTVGDENGHSTGSPLVHDLSSIVNGSGTGPLVQEPAILARPPRLSMTALLGGTAAVLVLIALGLVTWNHANAARPLRAVITLPPELRLITTSENRGLAISPDGTQMVFSAAGPNNHPALWLRRIDSLTPEAIPGTEGGAFPFWSPDGKDLGFFAEGQLKRIHLADHFVKTLCAVESSRGGTWSREGAILFSPYTRGPIYKISAEGGQASPVTALDEARYTTHRWPIFFPDGKHFAYLAANHDKSWAPATLFLGSLDGGPAKPLGESDSNVVPIAGSLLLLSHGKLMSQSLNLESGTLESRADILADAVEYDAGLWYGEFFAAATELVYRRQQDKPVSNIIAWFDRKGKKLGDAGPPGIYREVSVAPNGKTIATDCGDPELNVCLIHSDGSVTQVTHGGINSLPAWAHDSSFFSYYIHLGQANHAIAMKPIDEGASARVVLTASASMAVTSWNPDNKHALLERDTGNGRQQYFIFDLATNGMSPYLAPDIGLTQYARFSTDGNWVAYSKKSAGKDQIYVVSYPQPAVQIKVKGAEGSGPKWRGDGRELYYLGADGNLYAVPVTPTSSSLNMGSPQILFRPAIPPAPWDVGSFDVTRDGTRFLVNTVAPQGPSVLVLTTNWR